MRRALLGLWLLGCTSASPCDDCAVDAGLGSADAGFTDLDAADGGGADVGEGDGGAARDAEASDGSDAPAPDEAPGLPVVNTPDPAAAARGAKVFGEAWPGVGIVPEIALRHLYLSWSDSLTDLFAYYTNADRYWEAFRARYGFVASADGGLPVGLRSTGDGMVTVTCLICHCGRAPGGETVIGLANSTLDLQAFYDDLWALPGAFEALKAKPLPEPYKSYVAAIPVPPLPPPIPEMSERTAAPGSTDAMGLGIAFGAKALGRDPEAEGLHARFGFQNPNPWWSVAFKPVRYWDGSVPFGGHRTMMATLLGLGLSTEQLLAADSLFDDVEQYLATLRPPKWPFDPPPEASVAQGRAVFRATCSECHGIYEGPDRAYPARVVPADEVGTDPLRATRFGKAEAAVANALIADPAHVMTPTGGYLAPVLLGVWATAPYFHNGAVPDLQAVLNSAERPARWRRDEAGAYDAARMGWRVDAVAGAPLTEIPATAEGRRTVETGIPGMSRAGHVYGDGLSAEDRAALLDYLKTL